MTLISAHRGGFDVDGSADESARGDDLLRYENAIAAGVDMVEIDVRRTRDGVLVCRHDESVAGVGAIADVDYASLTAAGGQPLIRAEELLEKAAGRAVCHLDVKACGYELALVDLAADILGPGGFVVTSTEAASVELIRSARPTATSVLTIGRSMKNAGAAAVVKNRLQEVFPFGAIRACGANGVAVHWGLVTAPLLSFARRHDLFVMVWTVNREWQMRRYLDCADVDVVVTDRPIAARKIRAAARRERKASRLPVRRPLPTGAAGDQLPS
jgi:glycerophosphoryl diester phosphodiesterase